MHHHLAQQKSKGGKNKEKRRKETENEAMSPDFANFFLYSESREERREGYSGDTNDHGRAGAGDNGKSTAL
jgi:hypothetical protein